MNSSPDSLTAFSISSIRLTLHAMPLARQDVYFIQLTNPLGGSPLIVVELIEYLMVETSQ